MYTYSDIGHHEKLIVEQNAMIYLKEVSSGIYYVARDRFGEKEGTYINAKSAISAMNSPHIVVIERLNRAIVTNKRI